MKHSYQSTRHSIASVAKITLSLLTFSSVLLATGCANKEPTPVFTADPAAFEYAVGEAARMQLYMDNCRAIDSSLAPKIDEAMAIWYQHNWPQVDVADNQYSQTLADRVVTYQDAKIALPAVRLRSSIDKAIQLQLDQTRHTHTTVINTCTQKIAGYQDGSLDLSQNRNADLYLKSLAPANAAKTTPHSVPMLANNLKLSDTPGRSQYTLEKTLGGLSCATNEIITLRNEWPSEAYGAFCPDGKTVLVICEWGECKIH